MPEWPDLAVTRRRLEGALGGRTLSAAEELQPLVLRLPVQGPIGRLLAGRHLARVEHRGKFLTLGFDDGAALVVNPMLTGVLALGRRADACIRLEFVGGAVLDYVDPKRMGKVYYVGPGVPWDGAVPGYAGMGFPAPLEGVSAEDFAAKGRRRRCEVRNLLLDQGFIAGIGNAYADEILWQARLHPKRRVQDLVDGEWRGLHQAVRETMATAVAEVEARLPAELGVKVREHMQVRGRAGTPCPRCGAIISPPPPRLPGDGLLSAMPD